MMPSPQNMHPNPHLWRIASLVPLSIVRESPCLFIVRLRYMGGSGIRSAVVVVVGLCSRWPADNMLQRACGAVGPGDSTAGTLGFYTDPISPSTMFDFITGNLADWIHWPHKSGRAGRSLCECRHARQSQSTSNSALTSSRELTSAFLAFAMQR